MFWRIVFYHTKSNELFNSHKAPIANTGIRQVYLLQLFAEEKNEI